MQSNSLIRSIIALAALAVGMPAHAVYNQGGTIVGEDAAGLDNATLSFETTTGETVPVTVAEDDDERSIGFVIAFPGDRAEAGALTVNRPGRNPQRFNVPAAGAGETIRVDLGGGVSLVNAEAPPIRGGEYDGPRWVLPLGYGVGEFEVPETTSALGFVANGDEVALQLTDESIDFDAGSIGLEGRFGPGVSLSARYVRLEGDDDGRIERAPDGTDYFIVNQDFDDADMTGLFGGDVGGISEYMIDLEYDKFHTELGWRCPRWSSLRPHVGITYGTRDTEVRMNDRFVSFPDVFSARQLEIEEDLWKFNVGVDWRRPFNDRVGLNLRLGGTAQRLDAEFDSVQRVNVFMPTAEIRNRGSVNDWSFGVYGAIGLDVRLMRNVSLVPMLMFETGVDSAQVTYPTSGDDLFIDNRPVDIDTDSTTNWGGGVELRFSF